MHRWPAGQTYSLITTNCILVITVVTPLLSGRTARAHRAPLPRLTAAQLDVATPGELAAYEKALRMELALSSPLSYAQYVSPWVERQPHLEYLDRLIVNLINDRIHHPETGDVVRRLAVSMPPRHGKSTVISEHMPPWILSCYPDWRVILTSYGADFAATWGQKARHHIESHPEFGAQLDASSRAKDRWDLASPHRGSMITAGTGGPITGQGANVLIIDDPVKNAEEALSANARDKAWDWLISTAYTRLEPIAYVLLLQTRWHEDDLLGKAVSTQGDEWLYVNLPAIAMEDDPLGRLPGEALCPPWYDLAALAQKQKDETEGQWFSAMYQGMPTVLGGGIFKEAEFRRWTRTQSHYVLHAPPDGGDDTRYVPLDDCTRIQTVDLAATKTTTADFSVISTWDITPDRDALLVDRVRERLESSEHLSWLTKHYRRMKPRYVIVEKKTYGLTLLQAGMRAGLPVRAGHEGNDDKVAMAIPAGSIITAGRVYFPTPAFAPWIGEFTHELLQFPNGKHDDQVDTLSLLAEHIVTGAMSTPAKQAWRQKNTLEAKMERHMRRKEKANKRRPRHPDLGKL